MQAALNDLSSSSSAEGRNQAAETYLKTPRPVEVGALPPFCLWCQDLAARFHCSMRSRGRS